MPITFAAQEPKEAPANAVLKPGEYSFEIIDAKESKTENDTMKLRAGTPKIELKLRVNNEVNVYDNLYFAQSTFWKIDALLKSIDKHPGEGEVVEIDAFDLVGERGTVRIKTGKTNAGNPRNEVDAYTWGKF